jgi:hypothetical protein
MKRAKSCAADQDERLGAFSGTALVGVGQPARRFAHLPCTVDMTSPVNLNYSRLSSFAGSN